MLDLDGLRGDGVDGRRARPPPTTGAPPSGSARAFDDPDEATEVLAELAGPRPTARSGPRASTCDRSAFRTRWRFGGTVDLERGLALPGVAPQADGEPLPEDLGQLEERLGDSLDRLLRLRDRRAPARRRALQRHDQGGQRRGVAGRASATGPLDLEATGTRTHPLPYVLIGLGGLALLVGLVVLLVRLAGRVTAADGGGPARR